MPRHQSSFIYLTLDQKSTNFTKNRSLSHDLKTKLLPKVELHCHLEGIARFETVYDIATKKRNGLENQIDNPKVDPLSENWTTPDEFRELITISGTLFVIISRIKFWFSNDFQFTMKCRW